jgi:uncharacterized membrane protein
MEDRERSLRSVATAVYALQAAGFLFGITWLVVGLLWGVIGGVLLLALVGYLVLAANAVWIIYRIVKGWLRLAERREVA